MFRFAALAVLVTGCLDFSTGRYWRCNSASDCVGGWYCAGDGVCRPPGEGRASSCVVDSQCAPGWRCNVVGVCQQTQSVALRSFEVEVRQRSPLIEVTRVVAGPSLPDGPMSTTTPLFVEARDGGWLLDLRLDFSEGGDGIIQLSSLERGDVTSPSPDDEVALTDELVSSRAGQLCTHDATARRCTSGGGLLRSTAVQSGATFTRGLLIGSGSTVERRPGGRWDVGGSVVDLAGVQVGSCDEGVVAAVSVAPDRFGVLLADGGFPAFRLGPGERARRVRHATAADRAARVLLEVAAPDGGTLLDLYALACSGQLRRLARFDAPCQAGEALADFSWLADDRLERVCGDEVLLLEPISEVLDRSRIDTSSAGLHAAASEGGAIRFGPGLQRGLKLVLEEPLESAFFIDAPRGPLVVARTPTGGTYGVSERVGLVLARSEPADQAFILGTVRGLEHLQVVASGLIVSETTGLVFRPQQAPSSRRTAGTFGRTVEFMAEGSFLEVVSFVGDGIFVGRTRVGEAGALALRDRPAPGFDIGSAAIRFADDGSVLASGFVVANGRLFSVTISQTLRVTTTQLPLTGLEARVVGRAGEGYVAIIDDGRVVALPSLLALSPPVIEGGSIDSAAVWCGMPVTTATGLAEGDSGQAEVTSVFAALHQGSWQLLEAPQSSLHVLERPGRSLLWLSSEAGEVFEFGGETGACP